MKTRFWHRLVSGLLAVLSGGVIVPSSTGEGSSDRTEIRLEVGRQPQLENASWPISTGVPFPDGTLRDVGQLTLLEDGQPVPAQMVARATWRPGGGVKWVGLDFTARWEGFRARDYRLVQRAESGGAQTTRLAASQTDSTIVVDTGVLRFRVDRVHFAGVEQVFYDADGNGAYDPSERAVDRQGGPFVVDETGTVFAARDQLPAEAKDDSGVTIEELGTQRVTIRAVGWYVSPSGDRLCKFVTRISAFAEQPMIHVSHRTLLTYDTRADRLTDVGWEVVSAYQGGHFRFGGENGAPFSGMLAGSGKGVFLHQYRADRFRVETDDGVRIGEGGRSEGWLSVSPSPPGRVAITLALREIYQKFPKELELHTPTDGRSRLVAHFWPKHGFDAFGDPATNASQHTTPENIYKIRYAHQGKTLRLHVPPEYRDEMTGHLTQELGDPDSDGEITRLNIANGQGLAIANEFALIFHPSHVMTREVAQQVALFRENPHAIASPSWNVATGVLGDLSAADRFFDPAVERALELAGPGYLRGIVEAGDEYGMWIYGGVHDNWDPGAGKAFLHRVWQNSHYQNPWAAWMLYFRSGNPDQLKWARVTSDQFMDISTNNYHDEDCDRDAARCLHGRAGYQYHRGLLPWGADSGFFEHWVSPSAYLLRYYLTGDRRAWDLARMWFEMGHRVGFPKSAPDGALPCSAWKNTSMRDGVPILGDLVEYYQATWDPRALAAVNDFARFAFDGPFECTTSPATHPIWGRRWFSRYYDLTGDPLVVDRLKAWSAAGFDGR